MTAVFTRFATLAAAAVAVGSLSTSARAQTGLPLPLRLTSFAVNMSNVGRGGASGTVDFTINRWSTDAERKTLLDAFQKGGGKSLLSALEDAKSIGTIKIPSRVGYDLRYARHVPLAEGGARIILATNRPMDFYELQSGARTVDYPFTLIEIRLNNALEGEGKISVAVKITANTKDDTIDLENWASEPVRLQQVKILK